MKIGEMMYYLFCTATNKNTLVEADNEYNAIAIFEDYVTAMEKEKLGFHPLWTSITFSLPTVYNTIKEINKKIKQQVNKTENDFYLISLKRRNGKLDYEKYVYKYKKDESIENFLEKSSINQIYNEKQKVELELEQLSDNLKKINLAITMFDKGKKEQV